ncbi:cyclin-like protein [Tanacetum coccineum]
MQRCLGYTPSEIKDYVLTMHELLLNRKSSWSKAIREKFSQHKFKSVAALLCPSEVLVSYLSETTNVIIRVVEFVFLTDVDHL